MPDGEHGLLTLAGDRPGSSECMLSTSCFNVHLEGTDAFGFHIRQLGYNAPILRTRPKFGRICRITDFAVISDTTQI